MLKYLIKITDIITVLAMINDDKILGHSLPHTALIISVILVGIISVTLLAICLFSIFYYHSLYYSISLLSQTSCLNLKWISDINKKYKDNKTEIDSNDINFKYLYY